MTRRAYFIIAALILLALLALLIYSLDRTSWLLAQYELSQPGTLANWLELSPLALGVAAALVIEVGAVALVAGDVLALEKSAIKRYATAGLVTVLAVQALANLLAGFLRGWSTVEQALIAKAVTADLAWWIAGLSWVLSSAAVPALIFILSKLAAHVVRLAVSAQSATQNQPQENAQERSGTAQAPEVVSQITEEVERSQNGAHDRALEPLTALALEAPTRHPCPHCGQPLNSGRAVGAAKTNGFCQYCKTQRSAA